MRTSVYRWRCNSLTTKVASLANSFRRAMMADIPTVGEYCGDVCPHLKVTEILDSAIDLVDEACASARVARETAPEEIDKLERRRLELEVEVHALEVRSLVVNYWHTNSADKPMTEGEGCS